MNIIRITMKTCASLLLALATLATGAQAHDVAHDLTPLQSFEPASLERIVGSHQGRPFVVLVWSMDCEFCQASLDTLAKAKAAGQEFDIVTITTDPISDTALAAQVHKRLSTIGLQGDAWCFGDQAPERLRFAIDPRWRGEKPRTYWFDADGKRSAHSGLVTNAMIEKYVPRQEVAGLR